MGKQRGNGGDTLDLGSECEVLRTIPNITHAIIIVFTIAKVKRKQICSGAQREEFSECICCENIEQN